jgi:hypothetical protein
MTMAEFIAACFWPLILILALLLSTIRDQVLVAIGWIAAAAIGLIYAVLLLFYDKSSIFAVIDTYILGVVPGLALMGFALFKPLARSVTRGLFKETAIRILALLLGGGMTWMSGSVLALDFPSPRLVLEGRADNLRLRARFKGQPDHLVDVRGETVKVTTPIYDRLKFKPAVRVEVGAGSNYVYRIEYLAD